MRNRLLTLALAALVLLSACSSGGASKYFQYGSPTTLGKLIPVQDRKAPKDFSAELLSGSGTASTAAAKGKVLLVNFWAEWCGPCKAETPAFDTLYRSIKGKGVDFLGIDTKDDRGNAQDFVRNNQISYPIVYDQQGRALLTLGNFPSNLPFTLLLDKQGRVAAVYIARLTTVDLTGPINTLLAEK